MCLAHQARRGEAHQDGDGKPHVWHQLKLSGALLQLYRRFDERVLQRVAGSQQRLVSGDAGVRIREVFVSRASRALEPVGTKLRDSSQ